MAEQAARDFSVELRPMTKASIANEAEKFNIEYDQLLKMIIDHATKYSLNLLQAKKAIVESLSSEILQDGISLEFVYISHRVLDESGIITLSGSSRGESVLMMGPLAHLKGQAVSKFCTINASPVRRVRQKQRTGYIEVFEFTDDTKFAISAKSEVNGHATDVAKLISTDKFDPKDSYRVLVEGKVKNIWPISEFDKGTGEFGDKLPILISDDGKSVSPAFSMVVDTGKGNVSFKVRKFMWEPDTFMTDEDLNEIVNSYPRPTDQAMELANALSKETVIVGGYTTAYSDKTNTLKCIALSMRIESRMNQQQQVVKPSSSQSSVSKPQSNVNESTLSLGATSAENIVNAATSGLPEELEDMSESHKSVYNMIKAKGSTGIDIVDIIADKPELAKSMKEILGDLSTEGVIMRIPETNLYRIME